LSGSTPLGGNRLALLIARLLAQRSVSNPSQDDLGEHQQHCAPPFGRQRQPQGRTRLTGLAHGVTPATEPAPEALRDRSSVICQTLSNYQRQPVWDIELFFKWIKQHLRIKRFYGTSENAVRTQIWIAISVYVLVAIIKKKLRLEVSLHTLLQVLSLTLFEKLPLKQAVAGVEPIANSPTPTS
jgi:hypothetical protein